MVEWDEIGGKAREKDSTCENSVDQANNNRAENRKRELRQEHKDSWMMMMTVETVLWSHRETWSRQRSTCEYLIHVERTMSMKHATRTLSSDDE